LPHEKPVECLRVRGKKVLGSYGDG
jgi:hypothetical protein